MRISVKIQFARIVAKNEPQGLGCLHKTDVSALVQPAT